MGLRLSEVNNYVESFGLLNFLEEVGKEAEQTKVAIEDMLGEKHRWKDLMRSGMEEHAFFNGNSASLDVHKKWFNLK